MSKAGGEDSDAVLSDVDEDDNPSPPVPVNFASPPPQCDADKLREELDRERELRAKAESERKDVESKLVRLKGLCQDAIQQRNEFKKAKEEAVREREKVVEESERFRSELEEVRKERDGVRMELEEATRGKEAVRKENEAAAQMLVSGIDKISGKVSHIRNFSAGGLPRSQKYTGLSAVAYGVIKRTNEIVEEVVRQIEVANKSRNEAREMVEQRNYEIAIEVSELEASISRLKEEVAEKSGRVEELEMRVVEKEGKLVEVESQMEGRFSEVENERVELRKLVDEYEGRVKDLEDKMEAQRPLFVEQLSYVSKIHDQLCSAIKIVDVGNGDQSDFWESLFVPQETGLEENLRASLAGLESIYELSRIVIVKTRDVVEEKSREVKSLNETVARLFREKEHVGVLLRSALSKRLTSNPTSKTNAVFQVAENGLRDAGIDFKFGAFFDNEKLPVSESKEGGQETKDDEIFALAGALENIIKEAQLQIIELQHSVEELRAESSLLKENLETQAKELSQRKRRIEELEEKERQYNENVEGLLLDIASAEEEITRWKGAAEQEAAAGRAVEQEYVAQISTLKQEVEEAKQAVLESEKKLRFKEETASAAMTAREAAEKSLRLADLRASRLRERVEELTHQLETLDSRDDARSRNRSRYACWPWEWLGIDFVGMKRPIEPPEQHNANEMELSEPLL